MLTLGQQRYRIAAPSCLFKMALSLMVRPPIPPHT